MSDSLDSLAIVTLLSLENGREARQLWYFGDEGIKRSRDWPDWKPDGITDLSAKEKLRRSKICEWLDNYFRRNPARRKPQSEGLRLDIFLDELDIYMENKIVVNVSNLPGNLLEDPFWSRAIRQNRELQLILVVLSLVYGGVHLATWNFAFASKTEHLLWKIACIDIIATAPIGFSCIHGLYYLYYRFELWRADMRILSNFYKCLFWAIIYTLSVPYALARIYIVVESFIGLRHVPIGVYAAVPWVQAIPHV